MEVRGRETTSVSEEGRTTTMDFDFEGNLALFDKAAVFSKISSLGSEGENRQGGCCDSSCPPRASVRSERSVRRSSASQSVRTRPKLNASVWFSWGDLTEGQSSVRGATPATQRKNTVRNGGPRTRDDECFAGGTDDNMDSDFDFEGNLALFDKAAVFSKISSLGAEGEKPRYRHDQNHPGGQTHRL
ncbi:hypothetical protein KUCAC02_025149 [Chaenocephalus aceratus]|nr:hypothetical protein KUCAC02_025149 [Chaenocephalus aceratus]